MKPSETLSLFVDCRPLVGGTKRNTAKFIMVIAYHSYNVKKH